MTQGEAEVDRLRVLAVIGEVDPGVVGGSTRAFLRVVPELERRGWELSHWTAVPSATQRELEAAGASVHGVERELRFSLGELRIPPGPRDRLRRSLGAVRAFRRALPELAPDVVLGITVGTLPELALAHRRGLPTALHVHEITPGRARHRVGRRLLRAVSDEIIVVSAATGAQFARGGPPPIVVHNGLEPPESAVRAAASRLAERRERDLVVGAIGAISERKGSDLIVEAARVLARRAPDIEVRLAGAPIEGAERPSAESVLARARAAGVVHRGEVDVFAELPSWDVLLVPSRQDPFPNVVLEAIAIGVPVIGAAVGGIPEQLDDGAGCLVPPNDPGALADAVVRLARDPSARAALAAAGRERATNLFSLTAQADGIDAAVRSARRRRSPAG